MAMLFGLVTLAALALRLVLKLTMIDPETGFYLLEGVGPWPMLFNLLLAAGVVAAVLWVLRQKPEGGAFAPCRVQGGLTVLSGFAAEVWAILQVMEQLSGGKIQLLTLLVAVISIGAGLYLMNLGVGDAAGRQGRGISAAGASLLILWSVAVMLSIFLSYSVVVTISDHLLTTLTLVSVVIFLVGYTKLRMGMSGRRAGAQTALGGLLGAFFGLSGCLPSLAAGAMGIKELDTPALFQTLLLLALSLWGGAAAVGLLVFRPAARKE